jgi:hypothetical protein
MLKINKCSPTWHIISVFMKAWDSQTESAIKLDSWGCTVDVEHQSAESNIGAGAGHLTYSSLSHNGGAKWDYDIIYHVIKVNLNICSNWKGWRQDSWKINFQSSIFSSNYFSPLFTLYSLVTVAPFRIVSSCCYGDNTRGGYLKGRKASHKCMCNFPILRFLQLYLL